MNIFRINKKTDIIKNDTKTVVRRVWVAKATGSKLVTIPRRCGIVDGDYVRIEVVE